MSGNHEKKKQIWKYVGKANDDKDFDHGKLTDDIYKAIKKDYRIRIPKKDLKHLRNVVEKIVDKYNEHW